MKKTLIVVIAGCTILVGADSLAIGAQIVGAVLDANRNAVSGATVIITTQDGKKIGSAITDAEGNYSVDHVPSGFCHLTLAPPAGASVRGQTVVSYVGEAGQTVNWAVAPDREAVATAMPGITQTKPDSSGGASAPRPKGPP